MLAQAALLGCSLTEALCYKTLKFQYPGMNIGFACAASPEEAIRIVIANWWNQWQNIDSINAAFAYNSIVAHGPFEEFVQMALKTIFRIGCAILATQCKTCFYIACIYAARPMAANQIIFPGVVRARCTTFSTLYLGLCGIDDVFRGTTNNGRQLFTNNEATPETLQTFINNGRVLFESPTDPICLPTESTVPTVTTASTVPTVPTIPTIPTTSTMATTPEITTSILSSTSATIGTTQTPITSIPTTNTDSGNDGVTIGGEITTVSPRPKLAYLLICNNCRKEVGTRKFKKTYTTTDADTETKKRPHKKRHRNNDKGKGNGKNENKNKNKKNNKNKNNKKIRQKLYASK